MDHPGQNDTEPEASKVGMTQVTATPLVNQVAGHTFSKDNQKMGMLSLGSEMVLKALQDGPRGAKELGFYERVMSPECTDSDIIGVRQFLASFHGTVEIDGLRFLKLENVTSKYSKPCIADLKMGKISYDPYGPPEKVAHQKAKCPSAAILGFQISGMMVFHPHSREIERMVKAVGHKLTVDNMLTEGIGKFFGYPHQLRKDVISAVISKLYGVEEWFKKQKQFVFYASSLLISYEGLQPLINSPDKEVHSNCNSHENDSSDTSSPNSNHMIDRSQNPLVDVRMIDFTHVMPSTEIDSNYLAGVQSLIQHLKTLLDMHPGTEIKH